MHCRDCDDEDDVHEVFFRFGWGRTCTEWLENPVPLCRRCRAALNGSWKYRESYRRRPTPPRARRSCFS